MQIQNSSANKSSRANAAPGSSKGTNDAPGIVNNSSPSENPDYKVGFDNGSTPTFNSIVLNSIESDPVRSSCQLIVDMSKLGTTNDGIDWANVDAAQFVQGCIDGYKQAH